MTINKKYSAVRIVALIFLMAFILPSHMAVAAQDIWEAKTPSGFSGTVNNLASFGDYVYLGTTQGVYRSSDRGDNWVQINTGLANLNVNAIAIGWVFDGDSGVYAADGNTAVYAATSGGIFKATLDGTSWTAANTGLLQTDILDINIDEYKAMAVPVMNGGIGDASSLYAVATGTGNIYRSDDGGNNWSLQNTGISGEQIKAIANEPNYDFSSGDIFAITVSNKVYSSTMFSVDGATDESWTEKYSTVNALNGITVLNPAPGSEFLATAGGVLRSDDAGSNWVTKNSGVDDLRINSIASDYLDTTILYAGGYDGIYKSINGDGDATWTKANLGIGSVNVKKVNTNPTTSTLVYAITDNAIFRLDLSSSAAIPVATDFTAPAAIDDLSGDGLTSNSVVLLWRAPGDDGSIGTTASYDVRYSSAPIDEENWAQATPLVGEPVPQAVDTVQNMTITGLTPDTQYYFAIKSADEVPNISVISTILGVHTLTLSTDTVPPAAPAGLAVL